MAPVLTSQDLRDRGRGNERIILDDQAGPVGDP